MYKEMIFLNFYKWFKWFSEEESLHSHACEKLGQKFYVHCVSTNMPWSTVENVEKVRTVIETYLYLDKDADLRTLRDLIMVLRNVVKSFKFKSQ